MGDPGWAILRAGSRHGWQRGPSEGIIRLSSKNALPFCGRLTTLIRGPEPAKGELVAGKKVGPESHKCENQSEYQSNQNSDELRRAFRGRFGGLGDSERIDKRVCQKK